MYKIEYLVDAKSAENVAKLILSAYSGITGFDTETFYVKLQAQPIDLIQLYVPWPDGHICYLFHVHLFTESELPTNLRKIITSKSIGKACSGPENDRKWLWKRFNVQLLGDFDIQALDSMSTGESTGLDRLAKKFLPDWNAKDRDMKMGRWDLPLSEEMQYYAAQDAYASYHIAIKLMPSLEIKDTTVSEFRGEVMDDVMTKLEKGKNVSTSDIIALVLKLPLLTSHTKIEKQKLSRHVVLQLSDRGKITPIGTETWTVTA